LRGAALCRLVRRCAVRAALLGMTGCIPRGVPARGIRGKQKPVTRRAGRCQGAPLSADRENETTGGGVPAGGRTTVDRPQSSQYDQGDGRTPAVVRPGSSRPWSRGAEAGSDDDPPDRKPCLASQGPTQFDWFLQRENAGDPKTNGEVLRLMLNSLHEHGWGLAQLFYDQSIKESVRRSARFDFAHPAFGIAQASRVPP